MYSKWLASSWKRIARAQYVNSLPLSLPPTLPLCLNSSPCTYPLETISEREMLFIPSIFLSIASNTTTYVFFFFFFLLLCSNLFIIISE